MVLKRVLPHRAGTDATQLDEMFASEAQLSLRLSHPHIVRALEMGEADGRRFLVMEHVPGHDLATIIRAQADGSPEPGLAVYVVQQICRALGYAHQLTDEEGHPLGLVHRDVSPSNILVGFDGSVRLCDFGIAKPRWDAERTRTVTGVQKGKPGFMAPEQLAGVLDQRADLFAAGVVLHETLTGRRLFQGASPAETARLVQEGRIDPPSVLNRLVPPVLDEVCLRALARDPEVRYQTGDEMAQALEACLAGVDAGRVAEWMSSLFAGQAEEDHTTPAAAPPPTRRRAWLLAPLLSVLAFACWQLLRPHLPATVSPALGPVAVPPAPPTTPAPLAAAPSPTAPSPAPSAWRSTPPAPPTPHLRRSATPSQTPAQRAPAPPLKATDTLKGQGTVDPFE